MESFWWRTSIFASPWLYGVFIIQPPARFAYLPQMLSLQRSKWNVMMFIEKLEKVSSCLFRSKNRFQIFSFSLWARRKSEKEGKNSRHLLGFKTGYEDFHSANADECHWQLGKRQKWFSCCCFRQLPEEKRQNKEPNPFGICSNFSNISACELLCYVDFPTLPEHLISFPISMQIVWPH